MRLMIVDDNPAMRRLLRSVVRGASESIWEYTDGTDALNAYREHLPDLVLMDIEMPHTDGLTATRAIRGEFPNARVVIVTQHADALTRSAAAAAGACAFVPKTDLSELRGIVRTELAGE
jgi:CheY-like chemotaxis protein